MLRPQKLDPESSMYIRGFDRRGAAASIHDTSDNGFTVSGLFADQADFSILVLFDETDLYGHLTTTKYLPDNSLRGMVLDFDLATAGLMPLESLKFASIPWNQLSYYSPTGGGAAQGGFLQPLLTAASGMQAASGVWAVAGSSGSIAPGDTVSLWYLNLNYTYEHPNNPAGSSVEASNITFFAGGAGTHHSLTVNYNLASSGVYTYTEQSGDGSFDVAVGIAAAVNGIAHTGSSTNGPDTYVQASAVFAIPNLIITPRINSGQLVAITDSADGAGYNLLLYTGTDLYAGVALNLAYQVNNSGWTVIQPTTALMATVNGRNLTIQAARYGTASFSGSMASVLSPSTFAQLSPSGNQNFLGSNDGDLIIVGGDFPASIISVGPTPNQCTLGPAPGSSGSVSLFGVAAYLCPGGGVDGNALELYELHSGSHIMLSPSGSQKLVGGKQASALHCHIDFSALGIDQLRQAWITLAPALQYDSVQGATGTLVPFDVAEFEANYANWTITDPNDIRALTVAGHGSEIVDSRSTWAKYFGLGWTSEVGFYRHGFAAGSSATGDYATVFYSCGYKHDLYVGTALYVDRGIFHVELDGASYPDLDCYLNTASQLVTRRLVASGVPAGQHNLKLTIASTSNPLSSGTACYFDYLHAVAHAGPWQQPAGFSPSGVAPTGMLYPTYSAACDYDTDQTYKLAPKRLLSILGCLGFGGDIDFYGGVFFAWIRNRYGGYFPSATVTIGGTFAPGDQVFLDIGGTTIGKTYTALDSNASVAAHLAYFINETFVGVWASVAGSVLTITTLSPIYGFTIVPTVAPLTSAGTVTVVGSIGVGNEGVWQVDATQTQPLNRAFRDYLGDWTRLIAASGMTTTVAFSQEVLAPPDVNTAAGAWSQRYKSGLQVLTDTDFGSWGAGVIQGLATGVYEQFGHGYITGNTGHFTNGSLSGVWELTVIDADHYQLGTKVSGDPSYVPGIGDTVDIDLQTTQCTFNPSTFTSYITNAYKQASQIQASGGLIPWEQDGEVGWWFFSEDELAIANVTAASPSGCLIQTFDPHSYTSGDTALVTGILGCAGNGTAAVTVVDTTHFVMPIPFSGAYVSGGTAYGGSMAYYDAYTASQATSALGRPLASFTCQDSDPSVNSFLDANLLRTLLYTHLHSVNSAVKAAVPGTMFEWLLPLDVNFPSVVWNYGYPFAQGGRMNNYVNIPTQYMSASGQTDIDRLKMEGLSWGATYREQKKAQQTIQYPYKTMNWPKSKVFYLIPWFNGGCAWGAEYLYWLTQNLPSFNFWAVDHFVLLSWDVPFPLPTKRAFHS